MDPVQYPLLDSVEDSLEVGSILELDGFIKKSVSLHVQVVIEKIDDKIVYVYRNVGGVFRGFQMFKEDCVDSLNGSDYVGVGDC